MKKKIIIQINFNNISVGSIPKLSEDWINQRISIFMKYTLKSLTLQTSQDFSAYILYDKSTTTIIKKALSKYPSLPENIIFIKPEEFQKQVINDIKGYDYFYIVHLASDDLYHKSFIKLLHEFSPKKDTIALVPQYGYAYDSIQNRLGKFFFWLPSYGATIYKVKDFLQGKRHNFGWRDALKVPNEFINVKEPIWINHVHSQNSAIWFEKVLSWRSKFVKDACDLNPWTNSEKSSVHFGPEFTDKNEIKRILEDFMGK